MCDAQDHPRWVRIAWLHLSLYLSPVCECEGNVTTVEEGIVTTLTWKSIEGDLIDSTKKFFVYG